MKRILILLTLSDLLCYSFKFNLKKNHIPKFRLLSEEGVDMDNEDCTGLNLYQCQKKRIELVFKRVKYTSTKLSQQELKKIGQLSAQLMPIIMQIFLNTDRTELKKKIPESLKLTVFKANTVEEFYRKIRDFYYSHFSEIRNKFVAAKQASDLLMQHIADAFEFIMENKNEVIRAKDEEVPLMFNISKNVESALNQALQNKEELKELDSIQTYFITIDMNNDQVEEDLKKQLNNTINIRQKAEEDKEMLLAQLKRLKNDKYLAREHLTYMLTAVPNQYELAILQSLLVQDYCAPSDNRNIQLIKASMYQREGGTTTFIPNRKKRNSEKEEKEDIYEKMKKVNIFVKDDFVIKQVMVLNRRVIPSIDRAKSLIQKEGCGRQKDLTEFYTATQSYLRESKVAFGNLKYTSELLTKAYGIIETSQQMITDLQSPSACQKKNRRRRKRTANDKSFRNDMDRFEYIATRLGIKDLFDDKSLILSKLENGQAFERQRASDVLAAFAQADEVVENIELRQKQLKEEEKKAKDSEDLVKQLQLQQKKFVKGQNYTRFHKTLASAFSSNVLRLFTEIALVSNTSKAITQSTQQLINDRFNSIKRQYKGTSEDMQMKLKAFTLISLSEVFYEVQTKYDMINLFIDAFTKVLDDYIISDSIDLITYIDVPDSLKKEKQEKINNLNKRSLESLLPESNKSLDLIIHNFEQVRISHKKFIEELKNTFGASKLSQLNETKNGNENFFQRYRTYSFGFQFTQTNVDEIKHITNGGYF